MTTVLFLHTVTRTAVTHKLAGVYSFAREHDWSVHAIEERYTPRQLGEILDFWHPDGVIVECGSETNPFDPALFGHTPVVFLDRNPKGLDRPTFCVTHDSRATARLAARELLSLDLAAYAYAPWPEPRFWSEEREKGFAAALKLNGKGLLRLDPQGASATSKVLQRKLSDWLATLPKPVGIFAANDDMAIHVLNAASRLSLTVPRDVVVLGVDNNEMLCENANPSLSSILPDFVTAGRMAAEMLAARISNPHTRPLTKTFGPLAVIRRNSTGRTVKSDPLVLTARDLIRRQACQGLKAKDVVKLFGCSRRMAEIRFRDITGHSILDEIQSVRHAKATELIKDSKLAPDAIANFCGYASANSLRNFLRRHQ